MNTFSRIYEVREKESRLAANLEVRIRPMQATDIEEVTAIDRISFSLPWPERAFQYELNENAASLLWVAEISHSEGERRVVGLVVAWMILDEAHIASLAVHPDFRRKGIGERLLLTILEDAVHKGAGQAMLEVRASNSAAINLYRRFGFEITGRRIRYYRDNNEDAVLMNLGILDQAYISSIRKRLEKDRQSNRR